MYRTAGNVVQNTTETRTRTALLHRMGGTARVIGELACTRAKQVPGQLTAGARGSIPSCCSTAGRSWTLTPAVARSTARSTSAGKPRWCGLMIPRRDAVGAHSATSVLFQRPVLLDAGFAHCHDYGRGEAAPERSSGPRQACRLLGATPAGASIKAAGRRTCAPPRAPMLWSSGQRPGAAPGTKSAQGIRRRSPVQPELRPAGC
jgi:hypothetical protein